MKTINNVPYRASQTNPVCTIVYLANGSRYRDASGLRSFLTPRLNEIKAAGFSAWLEENNPQGAK
jgi:hypothetical protein